MRKHIGLFILLIIGFACRQQPEVLYKSDTFTIYSNKVIQGRYESRVLSPEHIVSNYQSTASQEYSRLLTFKFSINEKDNENFSGHDHWLIIQNEHESPLIQFGQKNDSLPKDPGTKLPVNYEYTFRLDMTDVMEQFEKKGYYEAFDGSRIAESDFKGVFIAGGSEPLTWDFSNLEENNLELKDDNQDGIYEITLVLNPLNPEDNEAKTWKLSANISTKPKYKSDQIIVDALYNLSLEEALKNIEPDSTLRTGAKWGGVWTRDVSYSTLLAFAYHEPEIAKVSLMKKVKRKRIIQDTGSGGSWPVSSDRTTWALAAWEIYKVTGEQEWLEYAYEVIKNTLDDDFKTLRSEKTGLYKGESSFLDWREQTYPKWMSNMDIYVSENLGTNVVHYQAHVILAEMAKLLNEPYEEYEKRANEIKTGINKFLWMDKGYYAQYLYGRNNLIVAPRFEALGEALAVMFDVADEKQAEMILAKSPLTEFGTTCIYPQIPDIPPYHNNGIWPFVQSFWNIAAAKVGNEKAVEHGLASIYRAGALFLSNYENFVAENGDYIGTEINSHRMLWSIAGNLAMVHRLFIGMHFEVDGIRFHPVIPKVYGGTRTLKNFKYRNALLNIKVSGYGNQISEITMDGKALKDAFFRDETSGKHNIKITMANNTFRSKAINLVKNKFSLPAPHSNLQDTILYWEKISGAVSYNVYKNGILIKNTPNNFFISDNDKYTEYQVTAVDTNEIESFCSEPLPVYSKRNEKIIELESYAPKSELPYSNYSGKGFVDISMVKNTFIQVPVMTDFEGKYLLDIRYSNGTGAWNTDNNCAIRSLYVNGNYKGTLVFPQRGKDEWSDWGYSNSFVVDFKRGNNLIEINFKDWNINMDGKINDAMLDYIRIVKIE